MPSQDPSLCLSLAAAMGGSLSRRLVLSFFTLWGRCLFSGRSWGAPTLHLVRADWVCWLYACGPAGLYTHGAPDYIHEGLLGYVHMGLLGYIHVGLLGYSHIDPLGYIHTGLLSYNNGISLTSCHISGPGILI